MQFEGSKRKSADGAKVDVQTKENRSAKVVASLWVLKWMNQWKECESWALLP